MNRPTPPMPPERPRYLRVVRPGGAGRDGVLPPPMPLAAPAQLPPWLDGTPPPPPSDEELLRRQLTAVVGGLQPAPDALARLREAVPQRRAQRRRIGLAAAAVAALGVIGVSVAQPFQDNESVQTASATQGADGRYATTPGAGAGSRPGTGGGAGYAATALPGQGGSGLLVTTAPSGAPVPPPATAGQTGSTLGPAECTRAQLGRGTAEVGTPDGNGIVYGSFRVVNVSRASCAVSDPGTVDVVSAADPAQVRVLPHAVGDGVGGLPSPPASGSGPLVLAPGQSYLLPFAWVPVSGGCGSTASPSASASPTGQPSASASPTDAGGSASPAASGAAAPQGDAGAAAQPQAAVAASGPPAVVLGHTPAAGGTAAASATIPDACAGTVYRAAPVPGQ